MVQPRVFGEPAAGADVDRSDAGPSLRVRGRLLDYQHAGSFPWFIPACADMLRISLKWITDSGDVDHGFR